MVRRDADRRWLAVAALAFVAVGLIVLAVGVSGPAPHTPHARPRPARVADVAPAPVADPPPPPRPRPAPVAPPPPEDAPPPDAAAEPSPTAWLRGHVRGAVEGTRVRACGMVTTTDPAGAWSAEVPAGACEVVAIRQDGQFRLLSDPVDLELAPGDERIVDLALPEHRAGGLGISIRPAGDGIRVMDTIDGGAAREAGLQRGDVILEIDGEPTAGMDLEEFQRWGIGKPGSVAALVVAHADGTEETVRLDRRALE